MGNEFIINKAGIPEKEIFEKFGKAPEAITVAEKPDESSYKEPTFEVGNDGRLFGGDLSAFERLKQLTQQNEGNEESFASSNLAMEPCCQ